MPLKTTEQEMREREFDRHLREIWRIVLGSVRFDEQEATERARAYVAAHLRPQAGGNGKDAEALVRAAIAGVRAALDEVRKDAEP